MRHRKRFNHLGRKAEHRKAMLANMATSLILHKRIKTTVAKAKALRQFIEPLITRAKKKYNETKEQYTHNMRIAFKRLRNKYAVKELFGIISEKVQDRPGGYTRILKLGRRPGDGAQMAYIELVDFNTTYHIDKEKTEKKRRTRRGGKKKKSQDVQQVAETNVKEMIADQSQQQSEQIEEKQPSTEQNSEATENKKNNSESKN